MGQFNKCKKSAAGMLLMLLLFTGNQLWAQCSNWNIATVTDSSVCAASGKITVSVNGADAGNLSNFFYSLNPLTAGGNVIYQSTTPVLENLKPGRYQVLVEALCGQQPVSRSVEVVVAGSYQELTVGVFPVRNTLNACNTGRMRVELNSGRKPYRITLTSTPANYRGPKNFDTSVNIVYIDSLTAGTYMVSVTDACSTTPATGSITINELPVIDRMYPQFSNSGSCNSFNTYPYIYELYISGYSNTDSIATYSISLDGGPKTPYKAVENAYQTITLLAGKTLKDYYGKIISYYVNIRCQDELVASQEVPTPSFTYNILRDCDNRFSFGTTFYQSDLFCNPLTISLQDKTTNQVLTQTADFANGTVSQKFPYGNYRLTVTTADGFVMANDTSFMVGPTDTLNPYSVRIESPYQAYTGVSGIAGFSFYVNTGHFPSGTTIQLIYPYTGRVISVPDSRSYMDVYYKEDNSYWTPGYYVFRITDPCIGKTYDLPAFIGEDDVYRYNWSYTLERTCVGMKVTPKGSYKYRGSEPGGIYKVLSGTSSFPTESISEGESIILPFAGSYRIAISSTSFTYDWGAENTKTITFDDSPLKAQNDSTLGWICPGDPANSGHIKIRGVDGNSGTQHYLYKLAIDGKGETGPYLDSNYTGNFNSNSNYQLSRNTNYQIKIIDDCGASIVQRVTILDFANYQVVTTDKPLFCINDDVYLRAFNLPTTAKTYTWTGPDNFTSNAQTVMLPQVKPAQEGVYHVSISSDMCSRPIEGSVDIRLAPYITYCYSAVTDTTVNPYTFGMLGNWRASRTYTYYGARAQSSTAVKTNIRTDGAFRDFETFWKQQTKGWAKDSNYDSTAWVWNAESTIFNKKGFELENKDPLGRYNAGLYGYDNAVPVATVQNSRYRDAAFDGFEDYSFISGKCNDDATCKVDRRLDFSSYLANIDSTQHHTGRYSMRANAHDTIQMKVAVVAAETVLESPTFNKGSNACTPYEVLKNVRANSTVLLPPFSPVAGKRMLFSVWVKEEQTCNSTSYTNNKITLFVAGETRVTAEVQPTGSIIEGWQRYEQVIDLPAGSTGLSVVMVATGNTKVYFDDLRFHPYNANMKSFVYDPQNLRLMAELDENNYASFYEYDDNGTLTRVKKETERGIKTIKESRNGLIKTDNE
ncbi:hypothetical protein QFZ48_000770 [Chitinophaga sp. W2I13]|uniref:COG1470 family protein n=1 Tax=Chitinophaga sp. W2I13 TaxID=3373923 RepID=UPI003D1CA7EE